MLLRLKEVKEKSGISSFILTKNFFSQFKVDLDYKIQEIRLEIMLTFFLKINLNILQWPCIRFLSLTLTFSVKFHIVQSSFIESSSAAF